MTARVVVIDDHGLVSHTLAAALRATHLDVAVVDPLADGLHEAVTAIEPDLVLLDLDLGAAGTAPDHIAPLRRTGADVLVVTGMPDPVLRARCIREGAVGVLDKGESFDRLLDAIGVVLETGSLLTTHEREEHLQRLRDEEANRDRREAPFRALTAREAEVLGDLVRGRSVQDIANEAVVAVSTVRSQVRAILTKLDVGSQLGAIGLVREAGWVPPQER